MALAIFTEAATLVAKSKTHLPTIGYVYPIGWGGIYLSFTADNVDANGAIEGNIAFYTDSAGKDGIGSAAYELSGTGATGSAQLLITINDAPFPVTGSLSSTQTGTTVTAITGTVQNQASAESSTFTCDYATGKYTAGVTYGTYTLTATGEVASTGAITGGKFTATGGQTGTFTENSDGSGSMSVTSTSQGDVTSTWTSGFALSITQPKGAPISLPKDGDTALN